MIKNLIIPVSGKSSRFPNTRPKFLLTHPTGDFMAIKAISGLNLDFFDKIYFIALAEHERKYKFLKGFKQNLLEKGLLDKTVITLLDKQTKNQPETVYKGIKKNNIKGFIFIKDCDNYFDLDLKTTENQIAYSSLKDFTNINPNNKSYIKLTNGTDIVQNIIEKEIISTNFCVGGYGFRDAKEFTSSYEKLKKIDNRELYVSHIAFDLIINGAMFYSKKVNDYSDWGTISDWRNYCSKFKVIFSDIDGTLIKSASSHFPPYIGESEGLENNIKYLQELNNKENLYIILTTSRAEKYRSITEKQLNKLKIPYHRLLMDLPHAKRYLINDYSSSNQFPTAIAVNVERDKDNLSDYL